MLSLDPRDLINIPGAGRAEVALRACGYWDDGASPLARLWLVEIADVSLGFAYVGVRAVDGKGAIEQALLMHYRGKVIWDEMYGLPDVNSVHAELREDLE